MNEINPILTCSDTDGVFSPDDLALVESLLNSLCDLNHDIKQHSKLSKRDLNDLFRQYEAIWNGLAELAPDVFTPDYLEALQERELETFKELKENAPDVPVLQDMLKVGANYLDIEILDQASPNSLWERTGSHPGFAVAELQEAVDAAYLKKLDDKEEKMREIERGLERLNEVAAELNSKIALDRNEVVDIQDLTGIIDELRDYYDYMHKVNPEFTRQCPIPDDVDLSAVTSSELMKYQEKCRNTMMGLQEKSKLLMLGLQTDANFYDLTIKVTTAMADQLHELGRLIQRNISQTPG